MGHLAYLCSILHCEHKKQLHLHVIKKLATSTVAVELSLIKCTENGKSGHRRGLGQDEFLLSRGFELKTYRKVTQM